METMSSDGDQAAAGEQLSLVERARTAARGPRPIPGFLSVVAGLLVAGGFGWFAVAVRSPGQGIYLAVGVGCLVVFLALVVLSSRAGGIVSRPNGPLGRRMLWQFSLAVLPFVLAGIAAIFFGLAGCLVGVGVGLGVAAGVQLDRARRGVPR